MKSFKEYSDSKLEERAPRIKARPEFQGKGKYSGKYLAVTKASNSGGIVSLEVEVHNMKTGDSFPETVKMSLNDFIKSVK